MKMFEYLIRVAEDQNPHPFDFSGVPQVGEMIMIGGLPHEITDVYHEEKCAFARLTAFQGTGK